MMNVADLITDLIDECRLRGSDPRDVTVYLHLDHRATTLTAIYGEVYADVDRVERQGPGGMVVTGS